METGVGTINAVDEFGVLKADVENPLMQVEYSKDGGAIWNNKNDVSLGQIGDRELRVKSRLFGRVRRGYALMLRFTVTADVPVEMYKLDVNVSRGG
jgi:hypothetical protein